MWRMIEGRLASTRKPHWISRTAAALCLVVPYPMWARTLVVSPVGPLTSISQALRMAANGDVIEVDGGSYDEDVVLDRSVQLIGIGNPTIHGRGDGSVVTVSADRCTVRGFAIEHTGSSLEDEDSGILLKSHNNHVESNRLADVLFGIYLFKSDGNYIADNTVRGRYAHDFGDRGNGIHIWNSNYNTLERNSVAEARDGIYVQNSYHNVIRSSRIHDLRYGLHFMYSDDNDFEGNDFYDDVAGAAVMYSRRVRLRHNMFLHNRGFASYGILFQADEDCVAEENVIADNAIGIFMEALNRSTVKDNLIAGNDLAIRIFTSAADDHFVNNNVIENLSPMEVVGGHTNNSWDGSTGGNYWSDYDGFDLDGDGVGDVPYRIQNVFEHLEVQLPLLRLYLFSPAAQSLEVAERGFPVLQTRQETDERPLMKPVAMPWLSADPEDHAPHRALSFLAPAFLLLFTLMAFRWGLR
jgi:nitrous oxidase accessory protein